MQIFRKVTEAQVLSGPCQLRESRIYHTAERIKQTLKNLLYNIAVYYENISVEADTVATIRKQYN